jgi:hypothetical protein
MTGLYHKPKKVGNEYHNNTLDQRSDFMIFFVNPRIEARCLNGKFIQGFQELEKPGGTPGLTRNKKEAKEFL